MSDTSKNVALPAYLPRRLQAFRIVQGDKTTYILRDKLVDKTHDLEPWQFFVLEVLPGCDNVEKLLAVFEDRFGRKISELEVMTFFGWLADNKLLDEESAAHPLLKPFTVQGYALEKGLVKPKSFEELAVMMTPTSAKKGSQGPTAPPPPAGAAGANDTEQLPAGVNDAQNLDPRMAGKGWALFEIAPMLQLLLPFVAPLRWVGYLLPLMAFAALMLIIRYSPLAFSDLQSLRGATTLLTHAIFSLLTINILATLTQAFIAHSYRGAVGPLRIALRFGFFPRFVVRINNAKQMSRRERMWIHGGPILMRVFLFSFGVLVWYNTRDDMLALSRTGLGLAFLCGVNILVEGGNPLVNGNGYQLLAAFMDEPYLRGKAYKAFMDRVRGVAPTEADSEVLTTYALLNFVYAFVVVIIVVMIVGRFFGDEIRIGGATIIICIVLAAYLTSRTISRFKMISEAYDRSVQFDRWRKRALPAEAGEAKQVEPAASRTWTYAKIALGLTLLLLLFLPYPYDAGGTFDIYPANRQVITSDVGGIIEQVDFLGGESVKKGVMLARIASTDLTSQIAVETAKMAEQKAVIDDLKAKPKKEEVMVAQSAVDLAKQREDYSRERVPRLERLYADHTISFEELDAARKEYAVDKQAVVEKLASLALVKTGTTPEKIAAEVAKLDALTQERATLMGKADRTTLKMPFDGNILTLHLNERLNSVLEKGQAFATVEDTSSVTAQIQVPESDLSYVKVGSTIRAVPNAYFDRVFEGKVQTIDRNVTPKSFGNVVNVIAVIDNPNGELKTGMTGYSKIVGPTLPVWKAFTLALLRFFSVQVWSWIP